MEYKINLKLESGANLEMLLFSSTEHRWIFGYNYTSPERRKIGENPFLANDTTLVVNYNKGTAQDIELSMDMIKPHKGGKEFLWGVDVSKDSRMYLGFQYERKGDLFQMKTVNMGIRHINLDELGPGLVKPANLPFPLKDIIENKYGVYKVPFLRNDGEVANFEFPQRYCK